MTFSGIVNVILSTLCAFNCTVVGTDPSICCVASALYACFCEYFLSNGFARLFAIFVINHFPYSSLYNQLGIIVAGEERGEECAALKVFSIVVENGMDCCMTDWQIALQFK